MNANAQISAAPLVLLAASTHGLWAWLTALIASHGYLILAVLVAGESAGLPLPGETSLLGAAVAAERELERKDGSGSDGAS